MSSETQILTREAPPPRAYRKPTLAKGPILTSVTALKSISGAVPPCWVARAAFGETDIRWMIFREWLFEQAPAWFRRLYIRHGQAAGAWLAQHRTAQVFVRALMMPAVNRILRG